MHEVLIITNYKVMIKTFIKLTSDTNIHHAINLYYKTSLSICLLEELKERLIFYFEIEEDDFV